ncbi:uncharacterized protein GIQ15_00598 [Arthroderma uncinatum]|uniref:uncharacterized protein n=1 Tax=Arthroderma uncinatum TaxID=74035 RepID=UPI00144A68C8|nr:uncharacterized protein GIQ15_00598 [Arthroderma uncinatum]KAF3491081.1 hypothetical protein GIQ15_00598 [Arthroderma uncinatum]
MARRVEASDLTESNRLVKNPLINIHRIDNQTVAKVTDPHRVAEAEVMRFVRANTSIPVPEVYNVYTDEATNRGIILMEYIEGCVLQDVWDELDQEQRQNIISQLKSFIEQLRSFKGDFIGSFDGTYCEDPVFCAELGGFGPYKTEQEFNDGLIRAMRLSGDSTWVDQVARFVKALPPHEIVLTHSDLAPRNILVRGDKVVALLDWEMAGYYPEYWEYVKALYYPKWTSGWIKDAAIEKILKPYHLEHAIMLHMQEVVF